MFLTKFIGFSYKSFLKPIFFKFDPEDVHDKILLLGQTIGNNNFLSNLTTKLFLYSNDKLSQNIAGVKFVNPVGLSAGFDKDAKIINTLPQVGFGFAEIGSVTYFSYEGNPKPRLYRLPKDEGLVVYYGLKNDGVKVISNRIKREYRKQKGFVLGVSIARTNSEEASSLEAGIRDYKASLEYLVKQGVGDYYTINISCPNTFYGEPYTTPEKLDRLLKEISKVRVDKLVLIKMPINLQWDDFDNLLKVVVRYQLPGVVIGNLNKDRESKHITQDYPISIKGGVSGKPTRELSTDLIRRTYLKYRGKLLIVGVGGIDSAETAYEKITAGASLLQLITGMIYKGPQVIGEINKGLVELIENDGFKSISEAVGSRASISGSTERTIKS